MPERERLRFGLVLIAFAVAALVYPYGHLAQAAESVPEILARTAFASSTSAASGSGAFLAALKQASPLAFCWFEDLLPDRPENAIAMPDLGTLLYRETENAIAEIGRRGGVTAPLRARLRTLSADDLAGHARLLVEAAMLRRELRLKRLRQTAPKIVFVKRHDIRPSFIAYTEGLSDARQERNFTPGSALCLLDLSAGKAEVRELLPDRWGVIRDPDVSYDADALLIAWKKSTRNDDYHLYELDADGKHVRQLTFGLGVADYEGVYLPDDTIAFASSRVEQSVPCWYTEVSNLYKMNRNGSFIRRLAVDQVHAWHPQPTDDGRIVYSRWDYNDRAQVFPQALFQMNLDGTGQAALYGANSWFPTSLLHARQVPGTQRFLAVASGHHTWQQGKVVEIDPNLGRNEGEGMAFVAPRRQHPYERVDAAMQQREVFAYPYPLGDEEFIASWAGPDRVGKNRGYHEHFDLYWFDYAGAREWLAGDDELSCLSAIPLRPRPRGHVRPDTVDYDAREGAFYVEDVYAGGGMRGVARGEADRLRVVELRYRAASVGCNLNHGPGGGALTSSPISTGLGAWDVKAIVGETPIQPDGSAFFLTPAMKSLYFQVLNRKGEAIQTMRSWDTVQPGEVKSCVGCHSYDQNTAPPISARPTMALRKGKARLESFATGWTGFDFDAHVQPILDAKCVNCHNGSDPRRMDLRGNLADHDPLALRKWTRAYLSLTASRLTARPDVMWLGNPDGPWVRWINKMSQVTPLPPYSSGAAVSPLMKLLRNGHRDAKLTDEDLRILAAWIDLLVPFGGDYYRGAAWTPEQTAYYRYYEGKRRVNEIAEARELVRHRAGIAAADWFAAEAPEIEVSWERGGKTMLKRRFSPAEAARGAEVRLVAEIQANDVLRVRGARSLRVALGPLPEAELYSPRGDWHWTVPPRGDRVLPEAVYTQKDLQLTVHPLSDRQRSAYRNLACNVFAEAGEAATSFPHATASSECRREPRFFARAAIDGYEANARHGDFPFQSWGPERVDRPWLAVDFGRAVRIDRLDIVLRADFPHDEVWVDGEVRIDGRHVARLNLAKTSDAQSVRFEPVEGRNLEIRDLRWERPGWCALTELRVWGLDADRAPRAIIAATK